MSIQKAEMSVEQIENGQIVEQVVYPFVEYDHVTMENGMDIMSMIRDDVSTPTVTHDATSWRVGQGDGDVSESIVDSSVASMTIKGQTYQNILPSPSLRNSMTNGKTMQKLNEGYDSVNTVDGVCKSAILTGQTLVNVSKPAFNNGKINEQYSLIGQITDMVKVNNTYYFKIFNKTNTALKCYISGQVATDLFSFNINANSFFSGTFTTKNEFTGNAWLINDENQTVKQDVDIILIDYQEGMENWDIPYFEGMQSVKMPVLTTVGKNLYSYGDISKTSNNVVHIWKTDILIKNGQTLTYSGEGFTDADDKRLQLGISSIKNQPSVGELVAELKKVSLADFNGYKTISITNDTGKDGYLFVRIVTGGVSYSISSIQIEEGSTATSYEPYKSNILTTSEDVTLRGIGDIQDTLDCLMGEVTQAIYEYTFTGDEDWRISGGGSGGYTYFSFGASQLPIRYSYSSDTNIPIMSDRLPLITYRDLDDGLKSVGINLSYFFRLNFSDCDSNNGATVEDLKAYLKANPTTVQYPISKSVKTVDLSILNQDNQPVTQLNSFANGYIQVSSQGLIPSVDYEVPTSNSYHVDLMKPNTQYTMKNMQGTFTIDNIQYNASTNGTFTSPSALTNNFMITSVAQSQPMLLEGDVREKDIPYFKGIKSAFEDESKIEVLSTGKNLYSHGDSAFTPERDGWYFINGDRETLFGDKVHKDCGQGAWFYLEGGRYYFNVVGNDNVKTLQVVGEKERLYGSGATIPKGWYALRMRVQNANQEVSITNVMVEKDTETNYEPYKSNSTKIPLLSPLRSLPNGVYDELIIDRMKKKATLIQRIKSTVFNGSEDWNLNNYSHDKLIEFVCHSGAQMAHTVFSDRFITGGENVERVAFSGGSIYIRILKTKVSNVDSFKKWLSQNPLTVQYGLQTPLITEVNLEGYPYVYKGGHIFLNTEIAPTTEVTYSINQAHQIESSNEDILRHQNEINHLYQLIAQYVQVQYEAELIDIALQG